MSKYKVIRTEYKSGESLIQAIRDLGVPYEQAPDLLRPTLPMHGFQGDLRPQTASIVLRRGTGFMNSLSNDLGFAWNPTKGVFEAIVSDYDSGLESVQKGLDRIHQRYTFRQVERAAHVKGYTLRHNQQPDGSLEVVLVRR